MLAAEEDVVEYLGDLVSALGQVLQHGKVEAKKSALRAMASAASAAEKAFEPYVNDLLPVLQHYMTTTQVSAGISRLVHNPFMRIAKLPFVWALNAKSSVF